MVIYIADRWCNRGGRVPDQGLVELRRVSALGSDALEKRVAEHLIGLRGAMQVTDAEIERGGVDQARLNCRSPHSRDHRRERRPREAIDERWPGRVNVNRAGRYADVIKSGTNKQRIELTANTRVTASAAL